MSKIERLLLRRGKRWLDHAIAAPVVALIGTYLWANVFVDGEWLFWKNMAAIQDAGVYGVLLYLLLASLYEALLWGFRVGYRLGHAAGFSEHQSASIMTGRDEGKEIALTTAWRIAGTDEQKNLVRLTANHLEINLPAILGQSYTTARLSVLNPWDSLLRQLSDASAQVRERTEIGAFDATWDKMLRQAFGAGISDLQKQLEAISKP